ncbi:hypothetical protein MUA04_03265 [Enterobacteriaceae bacterium H11S18]|uniref:hypothetical protein n=1 Tax=Dryocola clanedunensis TaxID=2925396 RepID=UPI0022F0238F|nr:hypothetical protein [Dryocola clanedunensis]MCT4709215.1 hypothetical protein [Dryocola clanedunensis]
MLKIRCYLILLLGCTVVSAAATLDDMQKLNTAYPVGSMILCQKKDASTTTRIYGRVLSRDKDTTRYQITMKTFHVNETNPILIAKYQQREVLEENEQVVYRLPETLSVSMPAHPDKEKELRQFFLNQIKPEGISEEYGKFEMRGPSSYLIHTADGLVLFCKKETRV